MVRMTDLFKKAKKQLEGREGQSSKDESPTPATSEKEEAPEKVQVEFLKLLSPETKEPLLGKEAVSRTFMKASIPDTEETKKLYFEAVEFVKKIFTAYKDIDTLNMDEVINMAEEIVNNILLGGRVLLRLTHELDSPSEDYSYYDAVNVSILCVEMGAVYKYNKSVLLDLAVIGLLHDMSLRKMEHIIDKNEKLTEEELIEMRKHPLNIANYLRENFSIKEEIVHGILQHHERVKGQGYPSGLTEKSTHELAMIAAMADTYEAMTHFRPYKESYHPKVAILNIINGGKDLFSKQAIKALIACTGIYPIGSWVELNTGEIGKVLDLNPDSPLRPIVNVLLDKDRNKLERVKTVDLLKTASIYIKQAIDEMDNQTNL